MPHHYRPHAWLRKLRLHRATGRAPHANAHTPAHAAPNPVLLARTAHALAREHDELTRAPPLDLGRALTRHDHTLAHAYSVARSAAANNRRIEPAAEWLIDNVYLIRNEIRKVRETLPPRVWRRLPRFRGEDGMVVPRMLRLLRACIAGLDGNVEPAAVERYLAAYEQHCALDLVELWTLPVLVRVALVEGLAADADAIARRLQAYSSAESWAEQLIDIATHAPNDMLVGVAGMARTDVFASPAFAAEFYRLLEGKHPALKLALSFAEQQLEQRGTSVARVIDAESRSQAADQVSIANRINSLRRMGETNWSEMIERVGAVDRILGRDPAGAYAGMDFTTRGRYRHAVESLAQRSRHSECDIATRAIELAAAGCGSNGDPRVRHVGYYLIGAGRAAFARALGARAAAEHRFAARLQRWPATTYIGAVLGLSLIVTALALTGWYQLPVAWDVILLIALFVAASQPAVALVNWLLGLLVPAQLLPRMSFAGGIPDDCRTLVVVPWLLGSEAALAEQLAALEIRYLGNRDPNLRYGLLTDFPDAPQRDLPEDVARLRAATLGIDRLNAKYPLAGSTRFYLFHRPREWNARQLVWMGFERKRGKLGDLNRVLRGARPERYFSAIVGRLDALQSTRYVITLDADTRLPPEAARKLVETMAHPLNRPWFSKGSRRVVAGYGLLQPRVSVTWDGDRPSRFARLYSDATGLDPYTRAVSDVYQDLFGEASFVGKGIYDVDAFSRSVGTRFPNDLILSHDLLEGSYARCGLVSDIELIEHQPNRFSVDVRRRHRWTRGDWQIVQWLLPIVPGPRRRGLRNTLKAHHRWKILDNLRRGLVPLAVMLVLLRGWLLGYPAYWTVVIVLFLLGPPLLAALTQVLRNAWQRVPPRRWRNTWRGIRDELLRDVFQIAVLPFETWLSLDAILRSAGRLLFTRKHLLEWTPMTDAVRGAARSFLQYARLMWVAPATALAVGAALALAPPLILPAALPFLLLWLVAPAIAWSISRVPARPPLPLDAAQQVFLHGIARRIWHWFETFAGADENWLPPDNCQVFPVAQVAHRTSPTNIGMALLANLTALDFGYVTHAGFLDRTLALLDTLRRLPRHRGHFFNWYDTRTLQPLLPRYISSVDSGNLAGCLLVLANALEHGADAPLIPRTLGRGLRDTARLLGEQLPGVDASDPHANLALAATLTEIDTLIADAIGNADALPVLHGLMARVAAEAGRLAGFNTEHGIGGEFAEWTQVLVRQSAAACEELDVLAPWLALGDCGSDDEAVRDLLAELEHNPSTRRVPALSHALTTRLTAASGADPAPDLVAALAELQLTLAERRDAALQHAATCRELAQMDLSFLWDAQREQFSIGYDVDRDKRDAGRYDLLASEARILSFVAIAQGQVPPTHWFKLGRLLTVAAGRPTLVSWSGSMFEYLMPSLIMPTWRNTLIGDTCGAAVARQIRYGIQQQVPWGVSESAYNATDADLVYQYRAFGVPGLGLKRGLGEDLVVAPYATVMALMVDPQAACDNLERLAGMGALTHYGFYEALDYTSGRVSEGEDFALVKSWMAHHHGMSLLALSFLLNQQPMQRRFMREPMFSAYALLLREKIPEARPRHPATLDLEQPRQTRARSHAELREITRMDTPLPEAHLLSNGNYHVMLTQTGAGYSRWRGLAVTRWQGDSTRDDEGTFIYLRDAESGKVWSATFQPLGDSGGTCRATFSQARAEFHRRDFGIAAELLVAVSAEDDLELRRLRLTNRSSKTRTLDVVSYAEPVLAPADADAAHPVFSKLFLETEAVPELDALLVWRRARGPDEPHPWLLHQMTTRGGTVDEGSFETDREAFIGRLRSPADPLTLALDEPAAGHTGAVLDPIVSLRRRIRILPGHTAGIDLVTGIAPDRAAALALARKYRERHLAQRVFQLAWTHEQVTLQQLNMSAVEAQRYDHVASVLLYGPIAARNVSDVALPSRSALWKHGISGDLPIVLARIANASQIDLVRHLIQAHGFWQVSGLDADLLIWNEELSGYRQELQDHILYLIESGAEARGGQGRGRMFAWRIEHLSAPDRALMLATARCVFSGDEGRLRDQIARLAAANTEAAPDARLSRHKPQPGSYALQPPTAEDLHAYNGHGGFRNDGGEYVMWLTGATPTPAPWCNVLANPGFGSVISETGGAYTFAGNAHEFRLTPWYNDPLRDRSGEALWLRDEATNEFWSLLPQPTPSGDPWRVRHGFGYSGFEHAHADLYSEVTVFVAHTEPVKLTLVRVVNHGDRPRRVSLTSYLEWVLGEHRERAGQHVRTTLDDASGAVFARNPWHDTFASRVAFHRLVATQPGFTCDRRAFLGRNRPSGAPLGMRVEILDGNTGAGLDACSAQRTTFELAPGAEREVLILLGATTDAAAARELVGEFDAVDAAHAELERVRRHWRGTLAQLKVRTPDPAVDLLVNGWLPYQVLASRLLARSGYYQSGGAWGFRDQLQDTMALLHIRPALARAQLLRAARHQFLEGDVQHWWHPPGGKGVRTRISDDLLWLPWCTAEYVRVTGDAAVLDQSTPFIEGRALAADEESVYEEARISNQRASLYIHCLRAIHHSLRFGAHGLPLIGGGDWNDGMNRLGIHGRGESVWLGMFLLDVLERCAPLARARGDAATVAEFATVAANLKAALQRHAWDGDWYLRAWNDAGVAIGSARSDECRIDSLPQSWSVLANVGDRARSERALDAVLAQLVDNDAGIVKLFTPPFDAGPLDPGYIRGYVPGVRENGGQYTHAAVWVAMALAQLGRTDDAWRIARMLNPLHHTTNLDAAARYRLEPYVMAADVYAASAHTGRGGWSWYTGSAGWMYRLLTESLLGLRREGNRLSFEPRVPAGWTQWSADWRHGGTHYAIRFVREPGAAAVTSITLDAATHPGNSIELVDDGRAHAVLVRLDAPGLPAPAATDTGRQTAPAERPGAAR
ncbi:MAG: cyclic beta 1-2 glucan synthetase [Rhodanobacteraceae bacterium]|nr:MAG: cyclic beta 1-2 glucan synthetase [Rhodanobacteraceae bacterium]